MNVPAYMRVGLGRIGVDFVISTATEMLQSCRRGYAVACVGCGAPFEGKKRRWCPECADNRRSATRRAKYAETVDHPVRANQCGACGDTDHNAMRCSKVRASALTSTKR